MPKPKTTFAYFKEVFSCGLGTTLRLPKHFLGGLFVFSQIQ